MNHAETTTLPASAMSPFKLKSKPKSPSKGDVPEPIRKDLLSLMPPILPMLSDYLDLSPELIPIVTLILSQIQRRYHEGIFMLYYDLNGDGKPADREWREVYGILTGNQLAYWDAATLAQFRHNPDGLLETLAKPNYINFTDSVYNAMKVLPAAKQNLDNVIIVLTTLKNRYLLQFKLYLDLTVWYLALRLLNYEYALLQQAYTGALLLSRGRMLLDIRTILAEKRFDHEDWVLIRYGLGMAWKRCYAVIEPSTLKRKSFTPGRVLFYENDQKKKKQLLAVVILATMVTAIYPQSHKLIDHSTMLKLESRINFKLPLVLSKILKKTLEDFKTTLIFLMPEQHSLVPGYDTLIRFLIPLLDLFGLYGRPKRLKADRVDPESLLFGLPTLPHIHYLTLDDVTGLTQRGDFLGWDATTWNDNIKLIMKGKLDRGYDGCGVQKSAPSTAPSTPQANSFKQAGQNTRSAPIAQAGTGAQAMPGNQHLRQLPTKAGRPLSYNLTSSPQKSPAHSPKRSSITRNAQNLSVKPDSPNLDTYDPHKLVQLADIYAKYLLIKAPLDQFQADRNTILNGSHEYFDDENLPAEIRKLSVYQDMYPVTDYADQISSQSSEDVPLGPGLDLQLQLPQVNHRNLSYSLVQSPMTQYTEFNEQFGKNVQPLQLSQAHTNFSGFSDSDDESQRPPPPPHKSGRGHEKVNLVLYGTIETDNRKLSVHLEQGKLLLGSSLHSQNASPQQQKMFMQSTYGKAAPLPASLPQVAHSPRITLPNILQNRPNWGHPTNATLAGKPQAKSNVQSSQPPQQNSRLAPVQASFSPSQTQVSQGQQSQYAQPNQSYPAAEFNLPQQRAQPSYPSTLPLPQSPTHPQYPSVLQYAPQKQAPQRIPPAQGAAQSYTLTPSQNYNQPPQNYPSQQKPQQSYPSQGYPQQGYPQQGYPQQGYPQQYQQEYARNGYPSNQPSQNGQLQYPQDRPVAGAPARAPQAYPMKKPGQRNMMPKAAHQMGLYSPVGQPQGYPQGGVPRGNGPVSMGQPRMQQAPPGQYQKAYPPQGYPPQGYPSQGYPQ